MPLPDAAESRSPPLTAAELAAFENTFVQKQVSDLNEALCRERERTDAEKRRLAEERKTRKLAEENEQKNKMQNAGKNEEKNRKNQLENGEKTVENDEADEKYVKKVMSGGETKETDIGGFKADDSNEKCEVDEGVRPDGFILF